MAGVPTAACQRVPRGGRACARQRREETAVVLPQATEVGVKALTVPALELQHHPRVGVEGGDS